MSKAWLALARDERGTSVIETALLVPVFLLLLAGTIDLASAFSMKVRTQQATARGAEMITSAGVEAIDTGIVQADSASAAGVPQSKVKVLRWLECGGTSQAVFESSCGPGEETARYFSIQITNSYTPMLGSVLPKGMTRDGAIQFSGSSTIRVQ